MVQFNDQDQQRIGDDANALLMDDFRQHCDSVVAILKRDFGWADDDLRLVCIHRFRNLIQSAMAGYVFRRAIFPTVAFWQAFFAGLPTEPEMVDHDREFDMMLRFAAIQGTFSCLESDARLLVRALDADACKKGTAAAASILSWLVAQAPGADAYNPLLDLMRTLRNTIHNNGVHYPENGQNKTVHWNGIDYHFEVGKPIEFAGWPATLRFAADCVDFVKLIVSSEKIVALPKVTA